MGKWQERFVEHRWAGLYDELRPGRPRSIEDEQIAALLKRTLSRKPTAGTHWSIRQAAQASGISRSTVHRRFQTFAVPPHRSRSFKLSTDPFFVEKVQDIVGLYLNPTTPWCCASVQSFESAFRLDGYGRFDPAEDRPTLFAYFRETTLGLYG